MRGCRRCQFARLDTVREAVNRRGAREYITYWYRCPRCHEVSLSFRRVQHLPWLDVARASVIEEPESAPAPFPLERDPALTR